MKTCPQCAAVYSDDMVFCLQDGTVLTNNTEQPTVVRSASTSSVLEQKPKLGVSPIFAYLTVGLLALLIGGGVVGWLVLRNTQPMEDVGNSSVPITNTVAKNNNIGNRPPPIQPPEPTLSPMTNEVASNLIKAWEGAQDTRNFSTYKTCYDPSFQGIKRTVSGKVYKYNYSQWISDRQKMLGKAKFLDVRVDKLQISVQDDVATVQFDQYFRTTGYADFGPKVIRIKMTVDGPKIIFEELRSAVPLTD